MQRKTIARHFNVLSMTPEESKILHSYLIEINCEYNMVNFPPAEKTFELKNYTLNLSLSHGLVLRPCGGNEKDYRYHLYEQSSTLAPSFNRFKVSTHFYKTCGTLKPLPDGSLQFKKSNLFMKEKNYQQVKDTSHMTHFISLANTEAANSRFFPLLQSKPATFENLEIDEENDSYADSSFTFMRYFRGGDLWRAIKMDEKGEKPLSLDERLMISRAIMYALQELHQLKLLHRDVKPENIMLVKVGKKIRAQIIDFEYSRFVDMEDGCFMGTSAYAAPEVLYQKGCDVSSDVFSMGKTLEKLWAKDKVKTRNCSERVSVHMMILAMITENREQRWSLNQAIAHIEKVMLKRLKEKLTRRFTLQKKLNAAYDVACALRDCLIFIKSKRLDQVVSEIEEIIKQIGDTQEEMEIITTFLNIADFDQVNNKNELIDIIHHRLKSYEDAQKAYQVVCEQAAKLNELIKKYYSGSDIHDEFNDLYYDTINRVRRKEIRLALHDNKSDLFIRWDYLAIFTRKFQKETRKLSDGLAALNAKLQVKNKEKNVDTESRVECEMSYRFFRKATANHLMTKNEMAVKPKPNAGLNAL